MSFRKRVLSTTLSLILSGFACSQNVWAVEPSKERPHMDLAFCIDTTSSMSPEIENVKTKVKELISKLAAGHPAPVIRVGLVAYRDRGDDYVTKVFPFTEDIDAMVKDISSLQAQGGGDGPESVNEGLHVTVHNLKWDDSKKTSKLLFLIGDAAPHYYPNDYKWQDESKTAISKGIQINTIGCNGLQNYPASEGIDVFKQIAKLTDGAFEPLAYKQVVQTASGGTETHIVSSAGAFAVRAEKAKDWRDGVTALAASKSLDAAPKPASMPAYAAMRGRAMAGAAGTSAAMSYAAAAPMLEATDSSYKGSENNLDSILLKAAEKKAKKDLNVDYK